MVLLRHLLGDALRRLRLRQGRTLREVSAAARVSLGYLSEVERGQKEASSELLAAICAALGTPLSQVLREVSDNFALAELQTEPVFTGMTERGIAIGHQGADGEQPGQVPVGPKASARLAPAGRALAGAGASPPPARKLLPVGAPQRLITRQVGMLAGGSEPAIAAGSVPVLELGSQPAVELVPRLGRDITSMVSV